MANNHPALRVDMKGETYGRVSQENDFSYDHGLVVLPVASRAPGHRVIRLHGGVGLRTVNWQSTRRGAPPLIPAATDTAGDTLLTSSVRPSLPLPNREARGFDWFVRGQYTYVQNEPRLAGTNTFPVGEYPFVVDTGQEGRNDLPTAAMYGFQSYVAAPSLAALDAAVESFVSYVRPDSDGLFSWPLLLLAPHFSSVHLIGG